MLRILGRLMLAALPFFADGFVSPVGAAENLHNRIVIIVDASGSFRGRAPEAVEQIVRLFNELTERRERRSRGKGADEIYVIAIDSSPDIIMQGDLAMLRGIDRRGWIQRFEARKGFGACTDVAAAFELATAILARQPDVVGKYLFSFSDLVHEPMIQVESGRKKKSAQACEKPRKDPPEDFPWAALREIDAQVLLAWLPVAQVMRWKPAVAEQGLSDRVQFFSEAEAAVVKIDPPPKAKRVTREGDLAETRAAIGDGMVGILTNLGIGILALTALAAVAGLWRRFSRRGGPLTPRPAAPPRPRPFSSAPGQPRPVRGSRPPLNLVDRRGS